MKENSLRRTSEPKSECRDDLGQIIPYDSEIDTKFSEVQKDVGHPLDFNYIAQVVPSYKETSDSPAEVDDEIKSEVCVPQDDIEVYPSRFWILGLFSYTAFTVIIIWGTFGPISASAEAAFGWTDAYVSLLEGWGTISSVIFMFPFNFLTQKYGLRVGMLLATSLMTVGTGLRCITTNDTAFLVLASVAAFMNGMASSLTISLPAMVSSRWFPMKERATATAVGALATQLGSAGMYLPPLFIRDPMSDTFDKDEVKGEIRILMVIHFGMALLSLICTVIYFPAKPPKPPSPSSSTQRVNYFQSIKLLIRNPQVMFVVLAYVFAMSIPVCWISIMNFSLRCLDISQDQSVWIGITACTVSPIMAFIVARMTDRFYGYLKVSVICLLAGASGFFLWFLLITERVIVASTAQVFVAIVLAISLQYSAIPLMIEFTVELAYPCPESVVGALLTFLMDVIDTTFLLLLTIPSACFRWTSYALVASTSLTIIPLMFVKEVHKRSELDRAPENEGLEEVENNLAPS